MARGAAPRQLDTVEMKEVQRRRSQMAALLDCVTRSDCPVQCTSLVKANGHGEDALKPTRMTGGGQLTGAALT